MEILKSVGRFLAGLFMSVIIGGAFGLIVIGTLSFDIELSFTAKAIIMIISLIMGSRVAVDTLKED